MYEYNKEYVRINTLFVKIIKIHYFKKLINVLRFKQGGPQLQKKYLMYWSHETFVSLTNGAHRCDARPVNEINGICIQNYSRNYGTILNLVFCMLINKDAMGVKHVVDFDNIQGVRG